MGKKSKKKSKSSKNAKYDSVNVYDSDHSSDLNGNHKLPKHLHVARSDPLVHHKSDSQLSEHQPFMKSVSDPHIVSTLSEPAKISDNSAQNTPNTDSMMVSSNHLQSHNPNYRLSPGNNLSNIPHPHHHFNDMDDDIVQQGDHVRVHSSSAFLDDDNAKDTIIEVEEDKQQQDDN